MDDASTVFSKLTEKFDKDKFQELHEEMSFSEYLSRVYENPRLCRGAYQMLYDMIISDGVEEVKNIEKLICIISFLIMRRFLFLVFEKHCMN